MTSNGELFFNDVNNISGEPTCSACNRQKMNQIMLPFMRANVARYTLNEIVYNRLEPPI